MNAGGRMVDDMKRLVWLFAPRCVDRRTMDELERMLADEERWTGAHDLFDRIRKKTLVASRDGNQTLEAQYCFEEVCSKVLFNLTDPGAPFDEDSPYWIAPNAFALARALKIDDSDVLEIVAA
jgi:hypothetical protein